jgi:hypothetical protein
MPNRHDIYLTKVSYFDDITKIQIPVRLIYVICTSTPSASDAV